MSILSSKLSLFETKEFQQVFKLKQEISNPIDLSVGIPEENTPVNIKEAGKNAIDQDLTTYTSAHGIIDLRKEIASKLSSKNSIKASPDNVAITPGLTTGQLILYMALLDDEEEVIVIDPYYPPYPHLASLIGAKPVIVPSTDSFQLDLNRIESNITNKTKAILINSPNNPTGAVYSKESLLELAELARANETVIISDEIYEDYVFDGQHFSIGSVYDQTITLGGFSKSHAMTGWRLGYMHGPPEIIDGVKKLLQYCVFSSSSISQYAGVEATKTTPETKHYAKKRSFILHELNRIGYEVDAGSGAFYLFVKTPNDIDGRQFAEQAAQYGLIVVPGSAFSTRTNYFRISYGAPMETLKKSIPVFEELHPQN